MSTDFITENYYWEVNIRMLLTTARVAVSQFTHHTLLMGALSLYSAVFREPVYLYYKNITGKRAGDCLRFVPADTGIVGRGATGRGWAAASAFQTVPRRNTPDHPRNSRRITRSIGMALSCKQLLLFSHILNCLFIVKNLSKLPKNINSDGFLWSRNFLSTVSNNGGYFCNVTFYSAV